MTYMEKDSFLYDVLLPASFVYPRFHCKKKLGLTNKNMGSHRNRQLPGGMSTKFDVDRPGFLEASTSCVTPGISEMYSEKFIRFS